MCERCGSLPTPAHRILDLTELGEALGLWPASRGASPLSLKWLLEKERNLLEELTPVVGEIAATYVSEFDRQLKALLAKSGPLTETELAALDREVTALLKEAGKEFGKDAGLIIGQHTANVYGDIRKLIGKKVSFSRVDKAAMKWMGKDPHYWIQDYFGKTVSTKLKGLGEQAIADGMGREEYAQILEARFKGEVEGYQYWDIVSSAQLNRSRSWGVYESMEEQGVSKVQWSALGDESMCDVCANLDGTVFSVPRAVAKQRKIVSEDLTPDEYKDQNPWVQTTKDGEFYWKDSDGEKHDMTDTFESMTPGEADDGSDLQDVGIDGPPVHGACRCQLLPVD